MAKQQNKTSNWHPNFRIESELPDIKIIRTDFIINGIAGFIALVLMIVVVSREISLSEYRSSVSALEQEISGLKKGNAQNLKLSKTFKDAAPLIADIERFSIAPIEPLTTLLTVSEILPQGVLLERFSFSEGQRMEKKKTYPNYQISLTGVAPTLADISSLKEAVGALEFISNYSSSLSERPSLRDEATGFFSFQIDVTVSPEFK